MIARATRRIPVVLCIDIEPDPRLVNRATPEPWVGYEFSQRHLADLRHRFEDRTGAPVRYSWFLRMDPQIAESYGSATWLADRHGAHLETVLGHGDELGVHPHAYRWLERERTWLHDFANQPWVEHCLETSLEAFERAFHRPCRSIRWGDRWLSTEAVNLGERLGIHFDLTIEPGAPGRPTPMAGELSSGPLPDYGRVPRAPYVPAQTDFRRPQRRGSRAIRMIPLTSGHRRLWRRRPAAHLQRVLRSGIRHWRQDTPLSMWLRWAPPDTFDRMLDRALAAQRRPYLAFAIRTDIGSRPPILDNVTACLEALLAHPAAGRFQLCTPAEALALLEGA